MDNLINIFVAIIIIYSFLSPLFKKKQTEDDGSSTPPDMNPYGSSTKRKPSYKDVDLDIFSEIEQMMNRGKTTSPSPIPQKAESRYQYSDEHKVTASEHQAGDVILPNDANTNVKYEHGKLKISEDERRKLEKELEKQFSAQRKVYHNQIFARVRSSFRNPDDFRNAFIISEVLGKPKALIR